MALFADTNKYKVVRVYKDGNKRIITIHKGLTLQEAQEHCSDKETSWETCTTSAGRRRTKLYGPWFDMYTRE